MTRSHLVQTGPLEETPLILFTWSATLGAGLAFAGPLASLASGDSGRGDDRVLLGIAAVVMAAGLLFSLFHLGHPMRAWRVLRGIGRSPLSAEVVLAGITTAACAAAWSILPGAGVAAGLAAAAGAGTLLAIGWVYRLGGQLTWQGTAVPAPLLLGAAFGLLVRSVKMPVPGGTTPLILLLLGIDTILLAARWTEITAHGRSHAPTYPDFHGGRRALLGLRLLLADLVPALLLVQGFPSAAWESLLVGVLLDRTTFYGLAVRRTTESEIARVERHIRM